MTMLKLQQMSGVTKDNTPRTHDVYVRADHITAVYKDSEYHNTTITLTNGGYLSVMETPAAIMKTMDAEVYVPCDNGVVKVSS